MYCPQCEGEFRQGIVTCPDCEVALVVALPEPEHDLADLVTVFQTPEPDVLPVIRSLLEGAGIAFTVRNEEAMGLFPGTVGLMIDTHSRAAQIQVAAEDEADARQVLAEFQPAE